jgi:hypothetical protein
MIMLRTIALAALLSFGGLASEGQAQCVPPGQGQQMVDQGTVRPLYVALQGAGLAQAQVLSAQLCQAGGGWVYRVRYRQGGNVGTADVPAG